MHLVFWNFWIRATVAEISVKNGFWGPVESLRVYFASKHSLLTYWGDWSPFNQRINKCSKKCGRISSFGLVYKNCRPVQMWCQQCITIWGVLINHGWRTKVKRRRNLVVGRRKILQLTVNHYRTKEGRGKWKIFTQSITDSLIIASAPLQQTTHKSIIIISL